MRERESDRALVASMHPTTEDEQAEAKRVESDRVEQADFYRHLLGPTQADLAQMRALGMAEPESPVITDADVPDFDGGAREVERPVQKPGAPGSGLSIVAADEAEHDDGEFPGVEYEVEAGASLIHGDLGQPEPDDGGLDPLQQGERDEEERFLNQLFGER
jgi:hypothetical protein